MNHTKQSTHQEAVALGAVQSLSYILRNKRYSPATGMWRDGQKEVFSRHYFNKEGKEIAYVCFDLLPLFGLTVLESPRTWSFEFVQHPHYELDLWDSEGNLITANFAF